MDTLQPIDHSLRASLTTLLAHQIMQDHIACEVNHCPAKFQSKMFLVTQRKMVLRPARRDVMGF